jgi:hypothetical protein
MTNPSMMKAYNQICAIFNLILLFQVPLSLAQTDAETSPQTIFSLPVFSSQLPCAQACFTYNFAGCMVDAIGSVIGCSYGYCKDNPDQIGAPDNCYCRTDLQVAAQQYITSCVNSKCTIGDSSIDLSSAVSIYDFYCSSKGFLVNVPASTTAAGNGASTQYVNRISIFQSYMYAAAIN